MKRFSLQHILAGITILGPFGATASLADDNDKKTIVTQLSTQAKQIERESWHGCVGTA